MNIDKKRVRLFRKLCKSNPSVIRYIRSVWLDNELDCIDFEDYYGSDKERRVRAQAKKLSDNKLIQYWVDFFDCDCSILPKKALKGLKPEQLVTLDLLYFE